MRFGRFWIGLTVVILGSFAVLGYFGLELYRQAPPIPSLVVTASGDVVLTGEDIRDGQNVWQSLGGQELGSIWGHGAYLAPDWSADWLHRESAWLLDHWAQAEYGQPYEGLDQEQRVVLNQRLVAELRENTYDPQSDQLVVSSLRGQAIKAVGQHYAALFGDDPALNELRDAYAIPALSVKTAERQKKLNAFFFWTSWTCATNRPGGDISYTNNWPPDSVIGNRPTASIIMWSVASIILLLAGVGVMSGHFAMKRASEQNETHEIPGIDPLLALTPTPSMRATLKYFWVVAALIVAQVGLGGLTAHYGVEGSGFYGFPLAEYLPYAVTRTWHTQLGIFWIATAWLGTGLFLAPAVSGHEPKFQRLGVNVLFVCLLVIVVGSFVGQWVAVQQKLGFEMNFWFGHQGYEYVDLGRFWQIFLFAGLFIWLFLMVRAMWPAITTPSKNRPLLVMFVIASTAIALFYGAGLMWGRQTHLAIAEYWRWWVVHLWVEGFFEVFATTAIAFLFTRMGLLKTSTATAAVIFSSTIFLSGGIIGTFHHLYFTGTPTVVLALGSVFSALEIVPLVLIGFEAFENLRLSRAKQWVAAYKWPIYFFVAVSFWNFLGAGIFGFLINPPIALYYMQGLNTTPVHGHAALFGVYGMLGIGLMLFCLRGLDVRSPWRTKTLSFAFWSINLGLILMIAISMLPIGLMQTWASISEGLWYARSAEFMQTPVIENLRWLRIVGDVVFSTGVLALVWFVIGLKTGWSIEPAGRPLAAPGTYDRGSVVDPA